MILSFIRSLMEFAEKLLGTWTF